MLVLIKSIESKYKRKVCVFWGVTPKAKINAAIKIGDIAIEIGNSIEVGNSVKLGYGLKLRYYIPP